MTKRSPRSELIQAKIAEEQAYERAWAYDLHVHQGLPFAVILKMSMRSRADGGIGRLIAWPDLRGLIDEQRAIQGRPFGDRETRIERRQNEIDELARLARADLARSAAGKTDPDTGEVIVPPSLNEKAAKVLLDVRAAEARMHGDDAAQRVDVEVTTRTQLDAEIDAALERMDALSAPTREEA